MTSFQQLRRVALAAIALGAIGMSGTAFAQNTASGTTITNTATVNYAVNSIAQTPINASTNFVVDTVINLNVTGGTTVSVTPGQTAAELLVGREQVRLEPAMQHPWAKVARLKPVTPSRPRS